MGRHMIIRNNCCELGTHSIEIELNNSFVDQYIITLDFEFDL